jgi:hypothetical protein
MREIGLIKQLQIQRSPLKQGQRPLRYYDPAPLLVVERRHYRAMRDRFGAHLADGCAGENILIETDRGWTADLLGESLVIECAGGHTVALASLIVAAPCVEFSRFAYLSADPLTSDQLRSTLQFLDGGMRGFYARLADGQAEAEIRAGDQIFSL